MRTRKRPASFDLHMEQYLRQKRYRANDDAYVAMNRPSQRPAPTPFVLGRTGYDSVARSRGAAVTGEMKYFDTELDATALVACTTTWEAGTLQDPSRTINLGSTALNTPQTIFCPVVHAGLNGRIGRQVSVLKIKVRGSINIPPQNAQAAADANAIIRIVLVQDKQTNAAQMTSAQLFRDTGTAINTVQSMQNPNNFGRFQVLKEKVMTFGNINMVGSPTTADVVQSGVNRAFKFNYTFKTPVLCKFNSTNGGQCSDIIDNSFHMICGASSIAMAPTINYYARVCYKE